MYFVIDTNKLKYVKLQIIQYVNKCGVQFVYTFYGNIKTCIT